MAFSQNSRTRLSYGVQSDYDTVATTFTNLPFSTHSLALTKERVQGTDINEDRMNRVDRHGNRQTSGDIVADLRAGDFDDLLSSALLNDWVSDVLTTGTTPKYLTIEDYAADIDQSRLFEGQVVSSASFSVASNQMITTTYTLVGKDMAQSQTEKTAVAASGNAPFDSYSGSISLGDTGGSLTNNGRISTLDLTVSNSFATNFVVGSDTAPCLSYGMSSIEGSLSVYYEDEALLNRFLNEVETALQFSVDDPSGTNAYTFFLPRIKINTGTTSVTGQEGSRMVEASFVALYDSTEGFDLSITRPTSV